MANKGSKKGAEAVKEPTIKITAKVDGFRRAGVVHTGTQIYPFSAFTPDQLKSLVDEPLLVCEFIDEKSDKADERPANAQPDGAEEKAAEGAQQEQAEPAATAETDNAKGK